MFVSLGTCLPSSYLAAAAVHRISAQQRIYTQQYTAVDTALLHNMHHQNSFPKTGVIVRAFLQATFTRCCQFVIPVELVYTCLHLPSNNVHGITTLAHNQLFLVTLSLGY
jgi:hypothetical protein